MRLAPSKPGQVSAKAPIVAVKTGELPVGWMANGAQWLANRGVRSTTSYWGGICFRWVFYYASAAGSAQATRLPPLGYGAMDPWVIATVFCRNRLGVLER